MSRLRSTFNDFVKAEKAVAKIYDKIEKNVRTHGETLGWRGELMTEFNTAYDDMLMTVGFASMNNATRQEEAEKMEQALLEWLYCRQRCEAMQYVG